MKRCQPELHEKTAGYWAETIQIVDLQNPPLDTNDSTSSTICISIGQAAKCISKHIAVSWLVDQFLTDEDAQEPCRTKSPQKHPRNEYEAPPNKFCSYKC